MRATTPRQAEQTRLVLRNAPACTTRARAERTQVGQIDARREEEGTEIGGEWGRARESWGGLLELLLG